MKTIKSTTQQAAGKTEPVCLGRSVFDRAGFVRSRFLFGLAAIAIIVVVFQQLGRPREAAKPAKSTASVAVDTTKSSSMTPVPSIPKSETNASSGPSDPPPSASIKVDSSLSSPGGDPVEVGPWADDPVPGVLQAGERATAEVSVAGKTFALTPNEAGAFQRVYVAPSARITAKVQYPEAREGDAVVARIVDGGSLEGSMARKYRIGKDSTVPITLEVSQNAGTHRVVLSKGTDVKNLDFWVGAPSAYPIQAFTR